MTLQTADCRLPIHELAIADCRLASSIAFVAIVNRQLQSAVANVVLHPPRMQRAVRRWALRSPRRTAPLHLRHAAARPLRPAGGARVDEGVARRARAEHVAVSRADAALRRRAAAHARRRLDAADPREAARRATSGSTRLFVKDESLNPTNSFKARGLAAAVTKASLLGAKTLSIPSAGNAANAMAAYAAAAGITAKVFMPKDVKVPFIRECELYGADVTLVDGLITDAGRIAAETGKPLGWYDVSTLKEPYRIEGKKTMAYELGEQLGLAVPRLDHLSDRRRHRHGRHVEGVRGDGSDRLEAAGTPAEDGLGPGRSTARRSCARSSRAPSAPRCSPTRAPSPTACACRRRSATSSSCAPSARAAARRSPCRDADMVARHARAGREGRHQRRARRRRGADCAQGPADARRRRPSDTVVLFNTGGALKYLDVLEWR